MSHKATTKKDCANFHSAITLHRYIVPAIQEDRTINYWPAKPRKVFTFKPTVSCQRGPRDRPVIAEPSYISTACHFPRRYGVGQIPEFGGRNLQRASEIEEDYHKEVGIVRLEHVGTADVHIT